MEKKTTQSFAPLHLIVLATRDFGELRTTLELMVADAGYPHALTVVELTGDSRAREYLYAMQAAGWVQNIVFASDNGLSWIQNGTSKEVGRALALVDAPYTVMVPAGARMDRAGWLRRVLEKMLRHDVSILGCSDMDDPERSLIRKTKEWLKQALASQVEVIAACREELVEVDTFTARQVGNHTMTGRLKHSASAFVAGGDCGYSGHC